MFCSILPAIDSDWNYSIHTLSSSSISDSISCFRSLLYLFPHNVSSSIPFDVPSPRSFPSSSCWLYSLLNNFFSFNLPLTPQPYHLILYHSKVLFIYVFYPFSSIIKHFAFIYIMRLLIHRFPFPNQHLLQKITFVMGGSALNFTILYTLLIFALLIYQRSFIYITYRRLSLYTLHFYHQLLLST